MDAAESVKRYEAERPQYERLATKVRQLLTEILSDAGIRAECESRGKGIESFRAKITRPGKEYKDPLSDVTDLAGVRVIVQSLADVERVAEMISSEFEIDVNRSTNKAAQLDPDRFGYLSQHFIVRLKAPRSQLSEWRGLENRWAEIQVRTALQHAWSVIQHSLDYKSTIDVPRKLRRKLFRVSALLELADEELDHLSREIIGTIREYKEKLQTGNARIELNVDSLRAYVQTSPEVAYWNQYLRENTKQRVETWGDLSRDVRLAQFLGLKTIDDIDSMFRTARGWGEDFFRRFYAVFYERHNTSPDRVTTVVNGVVTMLMIASHAEAFTSEGLERDFGFGTAYILDIARTARGLPTP